MSTPSSNTGSGGVLAPRYRSIRTGHVADEPLRVAGNAPVADLAALARLFTSPVLSGEFTPGAFWRGVQLDWPLPEQRPACGSLLSIFADSVAELCAGAGTVGVKFSGGLDSLAVLCHLAELRPARRLVAYCVDLTDYQGRSSVEVARGLLERMRGATGNAVELVAVDPAECTGTPAWSPHGPRLDALPTVNAAIATRTAADEVELLLRGDGADELLGVPSYATMPVIAAHGLRGGCRYLTDFRHSGAGWAGEALAVAADRFPRRTRARWYWAATWPDWCTSTVSPVVCGPLRAQAETFAAGWISDRLAEHVRHRRRWAAADAADAFWPRAHVPPAGTVPEVSPFLSDSVVATARAMSLAARYNPRLPSAYQRYKAAVVALLPAWVRSALPPQKQYFTRALARAHAGELAAPCAAAAGLLDPDALAACTDTATRMTAAAMEAWLAGAHAAGYHVPDFARETVAAHRV